MQVKELAVHNQSVINLAQQLPRRKKEKVLLLLGKTFSVFVDQKMKKIKSDSENHQTEHDIEHRVMLGLDICDLTKDYATRLPISSPINTIVILTNGTQGCSIVESFDDLDWFDIKIRLERFESLSNPDSTMQDFIKMEQWYRSAATVLMKCFGSKGEIRPGSELRGGKSEPGKAFLSENSPFLFVSFDKQGKMDFKPRARTHPAAGGNHNSLHKDLTKVLPKEQKPVGLGGGWDEAGGIGERMGLATRKIKEKTKKKQEKDRTTSLGLFRRLTGDTMPFTKRLQARSLDPSCGNEISFIQF
ncbi:hypothetical protein M5K25_015847 [Dendrobium thyrsiflorum]|uniref:Uncharacterized protein n=1 Tax=Dendrobium thyrsiflorum TaxID=117978 RepID=A0ABD0UYV0_DENTH